MKVHLNDGSVYETGYDAEWLYQTWDAARRNQITAYLHLGPDKTNVLALDAHRTFGDIIIGNFPTVPPPAAP